MKNASSVALLTLTLVHVTTTASGISSNNRRVQRRAPAFPTSETPEGVRPRSSKLRTTNTETPMAKAVDIRAKKQEGYARPDHHFLRHERHGGPHRVQAGVREQGIPPHLDAHTQHA